MSSGKVHHFRDFRFRHLVGENTTHSHTTLMDMQHNPRGFFLILLEKPFKNMNDELHRRVIVIQHQHSVHRRLLGFRLGLNRNARVGAGISVFQIVAHAIRKVFSVQVEGIGLEKWELSGPLTH